MSFVKAEQLYRMAEMANARRRGISLRLIMEEFQVEERTARWMLRKFEDLFGGIDTWDDNDRRRWWLLRDVPYKNCCCWQTALPHGLGQAERCLRTILIFCSLRFVDPR
ncbi:hypothetical protein [Yoonia sp.]|uniref:hypothetical protein n=1 Tax=Yoonia sp. TaxID=2212373 RepID=UPI002E088267|nr:hypothetical protein [Yoonia sp.]